MKKTVQSIYTRLPGSWTFPFFCNYSLWLADDHLLYRELWLFTERYKRFYFTDIQALFVLNSYGRLHGALWLMLLMVGAVLIQVFGGPALFWPSLIILAGSVLLQLQHLLRGPCCACYLKTRVHLQKLPSLNRESVAQEVTARLIALIEQRQGDMPDAAVLPSPPARKQAAAMLRKVINQPVPTYRRASGLLHAVLAATLWILAGITVLIYNQPLLQWYIMQALLNGLLLILLVAATIRQHRIHLPATLKAWTWICLLYYWIGIQVNYQYSSYMIQKHLDPSYGVTVWFRDLVKLITQHIYHENPVGAGLLMSSVLFLSLLGATGFVLLYHKQAQSPPAVEGGGRP